jgi:hypothetical protein
MCRWQNTLLECSVFLMTTRWIEVLVELVWNWTNVLHWFGKVVGHTWLPVILRSGCALDAGCSYAEVCDQRRNYQYCCDVGQWRWTCVLHKASLKCWNAVQAASQMIIIKFYLQQGWTKHFPQTLSHLPVQLIVTSTVSFTVQCVIK